MRTPHPNQVVAISVCELGSLDSDVAVTQRDATGSTAGWGASPGLVVVLGVLYVHVAVVR